MAQQSDSLDHASDIEIAFREKAIEAICRPERLPMDWNGKDCYDCDGDIAPARFALGKFRCVGCQEIFEKNNKMYRRTS